MDVEITDYTPVVKDNPFTPLITQLAQAGEGKQAAFNVAADDEKSVRKQVRAAANAQNYTAHCKSATPNDDGTVRLVYVLGARQTRPNAGRPAAGGKGKGK